MQIVEAHADHLRVERSAETRELAQRYMALYAREISDLLQRMPRPLLLLLKTNDCLRRCARAWAGEGGGCWRGAALLLEPS